MDTIRYDATQVNSFKLLGDYWTLRIIDALQDGELRFCELQRHIDNLNPVTLTGRLKKLEDAQLINRYEDLEDKVAVVYALSSHGLQTVPIIRAIHTFAAQADLS